MTVAYTVLPVAHTLGRNCDIYSLYGLVGTVASVACTRTHTHRSDCETHHVRTTCTANSVSVFYFGGVPGPELLRTFTNWAEGELARNGWLECRAVRGPVLSSGMLLPGEGLPRDKMGYAMRYAICGTGIGYSAAVRCAVLRWTMLLCDVLY
eukprot:2895665-Rhodomonas_salina.2